MAHRIALLVAVLLTACGGAIAPAGEGGSAGAAPVPSVEGGSAGAVSAVPGEGGSAGAPAEACIGVTTEIRCRGTEGAHPNCRGRVGTIEMVCGREVEFRTAS